MLDANIKKIFKSAGKVEKTKEAGFTLTQQVADIALKIVSCIAIVVTGIWAYYQFALKGADAWVVNMQLSTDVLPYHDNLRLLVVHIKTKNPTSATLNVEKGKGSFDLVIRKLPLDLKVGATADETTGEQIATIDLLDDDMEMLPESEFNYTETIVVPVGVTISATAKLQTVNGTLTQAGKPDYDYVSASTTIHVGENQPR